MFNLEQLIRENPECTVHLQHDMRDAIIAQVMNDAEGEQLAVIRIEGNEIEEL